MHPSRPMATTVIALAAFAAPSPATAAPGDSYVALGDSCSSGTGTRQYISDGTGCLRSTLAYPSLVAAAGDLDLDLRACSGVTISDVTTTQLSAVSTGTDRVSISVGGNDAGFADVLTECAMPGWASDCQGAIDEAQSFVSTALPGRLTTLYSSIRSKAPNAAVVVVGYPRIFMGEDCNALTWFAPEEQTRLNEMADLLNSRLRTAAQEAGYTFVNPTSAFTGHAVCDDPEWLNGLSDPIVESYHPNVAGHRNGYAPPGVRPDHRRDAAGHCEHDRAGHGRGRRAGAAAACARRRRPHHRAQDGASARPRQPSGAAVGGPCRRRHRLSRKRARGRPRVVGTAGARPRLTWHHSTTTPKGASSPSAPTGSTRSPASCASRASTT